MKNLCLCAVFLLIYVSGYGQVSLPITFEVEPITFGDFGGAASSVVPNTESGGINTSSTIGRVIRNAGAATFAGSTVLLDEEVDFSVNPIMTIKVFTTDTPGLIVKLKMEDVSSSIEFELDRMTTTSNQWETLTFDFSEITTSDNCELLVLFFDFDTPGQGLTSDIFLFDDIARPSIIDGNELALPIDFEGNDFADTPIDNSNIGPIGEGHIGANGFNGGAATVIPNPNQTPPGGGNPSATVAQIIRHSGPEDGASIDLPEDLVLDPDPILCMNVFTEADIGTEVTLRIEDSNDPSTFMESVAVTTVSGAWDTLCFVYHSAPVDCSTCDRLSFLFDYGPGGLVTGTGGPEDTFLFDDIYQPLSNQAFGIFFTPGSQFFCPPDAFELSYPGTGPFEWYDNASGTGTPIGTDPTYPTGTLNTTTSFWVRDLASNNIPFSSPVDAGPTQLGFADNLTPPRTAIMNFTSNVDNGDWHGVDIVSKFIASQDLCTYAVTGRNLTQGVVETTTRTIDLAIGANENAKQEYIFAPTVPMNIGDNMQLEVNLTGGSGCRLRSFVLGGGVPIFAGYPLTSIGGEITFTSYSVPTLPALEDDRWMGFDYRISGDVLADPTIYQVNAIADCANPLPIELLDFSVREDKGDALLFWSTASERNNDRFLLMRTIDGVNFETVGTVNGAGNSSTVLNYSFKDRDPLQGLSYYMLKQVDFDGTESDSELVAFTNKSKEGFQLFPNPTSQDLTLMLGEGYEKIEVRVYDLSGRLINQHRFGSADILSFELTGNRGTYFVEVLVDEQRRETFNVMKL